MYSIFIADDNADWLYALSARVNMEEDFEVIASANNGKTAIELIERLKPQIIILDIIMPEYDGVYIVNYIREHLGGYNPIIYILSGIGTDTIVTILNELHIDFYSLKPVSVETAIQNLKNIVDLKLSKYSPPNSFLSREKFIEDVLSGLGLFSNVISTKYIYEAIVYYINNPDSLRILTKVLYPTIAKKNNTTWGCVEKNIRLGISSMKKTNSDLFKTIFSYPSDIKITNSLFLSIVSSYIIDKYAH